MKPPRAQEDDLETARRQATQAEIDAAQARLAPWTDLDPPDEWTERPLPRRWDAQGPW